MAWPEGKPSITVRLSESGSSSGQRKECNATVKKLGIPNDTPNSEAAVLIDVTETYTNTKTYRITTIKPPSVSIVTRPDWPIVELCSDALAAGLRILMQAKGIKNPLGNALRDPHNESPASTKRSSKTNYGQVRPVIIYVPTHQINNIGAGSGTTIQDNAKVEQAFGKGDRKIPSKND